MPVRLTLLLLAALAACGDDDGAAPAPDAGPSDGGVHDASVRDWPAMEVPDSTAADGVRRDVFLVPGVTPPASPVTGEATPADLDATQVLRYRTDADPPAPARAIVIAMPGFLGGGGSFDGLARALVARSAGAGDPIEVWAIDRRSNLLEDLRGMNAAEAASNDEVAQGYYFRRETVGGEAFAGFVDQSEVSFMSEWGLETHVEDLRRVIALVPEPLRRDHVFLMGHSLGASFAEAYASWRFADGTRAISELAGVILVDGALRGDAIAETEYFAGSGGGLMMQPGLDAIRDRTRFFALPLLGVEVYARAEIMSLRALLAPDAVIEDRGRDEVLQLLLELPAGAMPAMTNRAALGFGFDDQSNALAFAQVSIGAPTGGPVETYTSSLGGGMLIHPTDPDATYDWIDAPDATPPEPTPIDNLARSFVEGRSNFAEWYFPSRLPLDLSAVAGTDVPEGDYREANGLRAFDRELVDAPYLAIAAGLVPVAAYATLSDRMAPVIGEGRAHAGLGRDDERALRVVDATSLSHIDPLTAADSPQNPVPEAVHAFVVEHAATASTVSVPAM